MGLASYRAPSEAEAQCCQFIKSKIAFAVGSEDLDCLAFGSDYLIKGFSSSKSDNCTILELKQVLEDLQLDQTQFVDL